MPSGRLIPDELDTLRKECAQWIQQDEDVLSYALFPQVATEFFKYRQAQQTKVDRQLLILRMEVIQYSRI